MKKERERHKDSQRKYYSKNWKDYKNRVYFFDESRINKVFGLILAEKKGRILDIGCLSGEFLVKLKQRGWKCHGIELSEAYKKALGSNLDVIQHDVEKGIPFPNGFFDIVYAGEIIEHLYETDGFLMEVRRVLKPNGKAIITTPNIACLTNRILLLFGKYPRYLEYSERGCGHIHLYNKGALKHQLRQRGFRIIRIIGNFLSIPDPTPRKFLRNKVFSRLGTWLPSLSENLIFVVGLEGNS